MNIVARRGDHQRAHHRACRVKSAQLFDLCLPSLCLQAARVVRQILGHRSRFRILAVLSCRADQEATTAEQMTRCHVFGEQVRTVALFCSETFMLLVCEATKVALPRVNIDLAHIGWVQESLRSRTRHCQQSLLSTA